MKAQIPFDSVIFKEGNTFVAYCRELDVSSCGDTIEEARQNLKTATRLFVEEARKMGTLDDILREAGYRRLRGNGGWEAPELVALERMTVPA